MAGCGFDLIGGEVYFSALIFTVVIVLEPITHTPESAESAISELGAKDAERRSRAAAKLFQQGCDNARGVIDSWLHEVEFKRLVLSEDENLILTVGVAVLPETFSVIRNACGNPRLSDVPPEQQAQEFELEFPDHVRLDILTTTAPDSGSPLATFLRKSGEGIQQVELEVSNVDQATRIVQSKFRLKPAYEDTRIGADGTRVNFFLTAANFGKKVLIELVER